jgi:DNA (cytosine-5)-methyltransferase 1
VIKPAYYNEFDEDVAAWLRELIREGHIAPGDVDTRSIEDVRPDDLRGYAQCHFFAGIGVWSYALRRAGWPDDRPVWTGSCPCQPFSAAGKGAAFADERHLWPHFHWLISQCKPAGVLGEQVASAAVDDWIDLVHADLETLGYAFGSVPFPAASVGAPHIRDRNYWMAYAHHARLEGRKGAGKRPAERAAGPRGVVSGLADLYEDGCKSGHGVQPVCTEQDVEYGGGSIRVADTERQGICGQSGSIYSEKAGAGDREYLHDSLASSDLVRPGPTNGFWRDADWLGCRDGKWRPVEPGTFPLVTGASARVVRLRGYGNAINAEQAKTFIEVAMECMP